MNQFTELPGSTQLVAVADEQFPRHSEGDLIELADGRLLLSYGRKDGASDFDQGTIVGLFSRDRGRTWDAEPHLIQEPWGEITDVMSVSLCRTPRGVHLFFLGRGPDNDGDTRVYQLVSVDEGNSWSPPQQINVRQGYHIMNNARAIRLDSGRLLAPIAFTTSIHHKFNEQWVFCLYSDDDGQSWQEGSGTDLEGVALMEPGLVQCADGSIYMTIRTALGYLYESRSTDGGLTWSEPVATSLVSPAAPATLARVPGSDDIWIFWCSNPAGQSAGWADRNPFAVAVSSDNARTWSEPRLVENDCAKGFGYMSVDFVDDQVHLTYYDWARGNPNFYLCNLRQRIIPRSWF